MRPFEYPLRVILRCGLLVALALACIPATWAATCPGDVALLELGGSTVTLPPGTVGQPYSYTLHASGGVPPYSFLAANPALGLTLSENGVLAGSPSALPMIAVFTVSVHDQRGCSAQQTYRLEIQPLPRPASPAPRPAPRPAPTPTPTPTEEPTPAKELAPTPLNTVTLADALTEPMPKQVSMDTYMLTEAVFKDKDVVAAIQQMSAAAEAVFDNAPAQEPAASASVASTESPDDDTTTQEYQSIETETTAQLQRMLQPLMGVEFPGRDLFQAALDTRLCRFTADLIHATAEKQDRPPPPLSANDCLPERYGNEDTGNYNLTIPWQDVPLLLMSPNLRNTLVDKARQTHSLLDNPAPLWDGAGCGCVRRLSGDIYGFYPFWQVTGKPQPLDFSLLSRVELFAMWIKDDGDLVVPHWVTPQQFAFIREAHHHFTRLDYTLYRNRWQFLKGASSADMARAAKNLARQAADFIDQPLTDLASRSHAWVPGFAKVERFGDGLTLYLDNVPSAKDPLRAVFKLYLDHQIQALISELQGRERRYALNIVLRNSDLESDEGVWQVDTLFDYVKQAENPTMQGGRIAISSSTQYRSNTNVTVRYLVLLNVPVARSMRNVRVAIDNDKSLSEDDRRVLLHKLIPIVSSGSASGYELADHMAYFADNMGGAGFWTAPNSDQANGQAIYARIDRSFLSPKSAVEPLQAWVCEHRWPLRIAFEALLLAWLLAFALYRGSCRIRQIGLPYQVGLLIGATGVLILGAVLMAGDPNLTAIREGNSLLALLLFALMAMIAYHLLKPRVEKP